MFITKKKFDAKINQAYLQGYEQGVQAGKQQAAFDEVTANTIREIFGLPPINSKQEKQG